MTAALDNTFLTLILNPEAIPAPDPTTKVPVSHYKQRIEDLIDGFSRRGELLLIPSVSLAEVLCVAKVPSNYIDILRGYGCFEIVPFDGKAAYEFGQIIRAAKSTPQGKTSGVEGKWQHLKMDRQIVATALAYGASVMYTDDNGQTAFAELAGLTVIHTWELPLTQRAQVDFAEKEEGWERKPNPKAKPKNFGE